MVRDRSRASVERPAEGVEHAAEQRVADGNEIGVGSRSHPSAWDDAGRGAQGRREQSSLPKADDLQTEPGLAGPYFELTADGSDKALDLDEDADDVAHAPFRARTQRGAGPQDVSPEIDTKRRVLAHDGMTPSAVATAVSLASVPIATMPCGVLTSIAPGASCGSART